MVIKARPAGVSILKVFPESRAVVTFDGEVLEVFKDEHSVRLYVIFITGIEVVTDRNGNHELHVEEALGHLPYLPFNPELLPKVNELTAEVQKAKASFKLW